MNFTPTDNDLIAQEERMLNRMMELFDPKHQTSDREKALLIQIQDLAKRMANKQASKEDLRMCMGLWREYLKPTFGDDSPGKMS